MEKMFNKITGKEFTGDEWILFCKESIHLVPRFFGFTELGYHVTDILPDIVERIFTGMGEESGVRFNSYLYYIEKSRIREAICSLSPTLQDSEQFKKIKKEIHDYIIQQAAEKKIQW